MSHGVKCEFLQDVRSTTDGICLPAPNENSTDQQYISKCKLFERGERDSAIT